MRKRSPWICWSVILIPLFPLALLWPFFLRGDVLFWGTPITQFYPWRKLAVEMLGAGHLPLWNHHVGSGAPLLANHQTAVFYPLFVLYLLLPVEVAITLEVALHLFMAGAFMYLCARGLGLSRDGAVLAGLSYMGSGFIVTRLNFPTMVAAAAWLPLSFWLTYLMVRRGGRAHILALGVIIAVQFLAGHAQLWFYTLLFIGGYAVFEGFFGLAFPPPRWGEEKEEQGDTPSSSLDRRLRPLITPVRFLAALFLGLGLAAVQFLPTLEFALHSQRGGGADWEFAMTYSLWPWKLLAFLMPDFFGNPARGNYWGYANYWEDCGYIGVLPLLLAFIAIFRGVKSPATRFARTSLFLAITVPLSLLLALGKNTPVYPFVFRYVPGFGFFQAPARFLYLYTFATALLAGMGADFLKQAPLSLPSIRRMGTASVGLLIAAALLRFLPLEIRDTFIGGFSLFALLFAGATLCLWVNAILWRRGHRQGIALALLVFADLLIFGAGFNPFIDPDLYRRPTETGRFFAEVGEKAPFRLYTFGPEEHHIKYERFFRFDRFGPDGGNSVNYSPLKFWMGLRESQIPQLNMFEGFDHAGVFDPLVVGRYRKLLDAIDRAPLQGALRLLGMLNVRYIISTEPIPGLEPNALRGGYYIYENGYALPRAWAVFKARDVADGERAFAVITAPGFEPAQEIVIEPKMHPYASRGENEGMPSNTLPQSGTGPALRLHYVPNGVRIEVVMENPGYLVLSETYYPGWQVYVDGNPEPLLRANYTLMAVRLDGGHHTVLFRYDPPLFKAGAIISILALLSLSGVALRLTMVGDVAPRWGRKRSKEISPFLPLEGGCGGELCGNSHLQRTG